MEAASLWKGKKSLEARIAAVVVVCHENCHASSENVAKVLRPPHKTTFNTLQNTSECTYNSKLRWFHWVLGALCESHADPGIFAKILNWIRCWAGEAVKWETSIWEPGILSLCPPLPSQTGNLKKRNKQNVSWLDGIDASAPGSNSWWSPCLDAGMETCLGQLLCRCAPESQLRKNLITCAARAHDVVEVGQRQRWKYQRRLYAWMCGTLCVEQHLQTLSWANQSAIHEVCCCCCCLSPIGLQRHALHQKMHPDKAPVRDNVPTHALWTCPSSFCMAGAAL